MTVSKVAQFGHVPAGTKIWLTRDQAAARLHQISPVETSQTMSGRKLYAADGQLGFKAGEEFAIEGDLDRGLEMMLGIDTAVPAAPAEKPKAVPAKKASKAEIAKAFEEGEQAGASELLSDIERALGLEPVSLEERLKGGGAGKSVVLEAMAKAKTEGRAEMLAEVEARNGLFEALEAALDAQEALAEDADDEAKAAAQKAVDEAQAAIDALQPLVA